MSTTARAGTLRESGARSYHRRFPMTLVRANGVWVHDSDGRQYIDCLAGAGALALGHNHPAVVEALDAAMKRSIPSQVLDMSTPERDAFIDELFTCLPESFASDSKIQFCGPTGTDGVEAALKLTKTATGRQNIVAFQNAYHGMTAGSLSLMGSLGPKEQIGALVPGVQHFPFPRDLHCAFGAGGEESVRLGIGMLERQLANPSGGLTRPAAIVTEVVQGEGGVHAAPAIWMQSLRRLATSYEIPLVLDEVQTGLGRTGRLFAFEHAGIEPDVLVLSKAIGGGQPLSVIVYRSGLDAWKPGAHAGTFRGNQFGLVAGATTMRIVRTEGLSERAAQLGNRMQESLRQVSTPLVAEVRGQGLMIGVEIGQRIDFATCIPDTAAAAQLQQELLQRGVIVEIGGAHDNVVRFLPPLIINESELDQVVSAFAGALAVVTPSSTERITLS